MNTKGDTMGNIWSLILNVMLAGTLCGIYLRKEGLKNGIIYCIYAIITALSFGKLVDYWLGGAT